MQITEPIFIIHSEHAHQRGENTSLKLCEAGLGSSTVDQVLKYPKYIPSTSTGQVLIFLKYLSTSSTFISSTSTHIKSCSKVRMDIQSKVYFGWTK